MVKEVNRVSILDVCELSALQHFDLDECPDSPHRSQIKHLR